MASNKRPKCQCLVQFQGTHPSSCPIRRFESLVRDKDRVNRLLQAVTPGDGLTGSQRREQFFNLDTWNPQDRKRAINTQFGRLGYKGCLPVGFRVC